MNDEQWDSVVDKIDMACGVKDKGVEKEDRITREWILFDHPRGEMRLERTIRPKLIEEKAHYTKRTNTEAYVEKIYSETEFIKTEKLYIKRGHDWKEIDFKSGISVF